MARSMNEEIFHNLSAFADADEEEAEPVLVDDSDEEEEIETNPLDFVDFGVAIPVQLNHRFQVEATSYPFTFKNQDSLPDADEVARAAFEHIIHQAFEDGADTDLFGGDIRHPSLEHPILIAFVPRDQFTADRIMQRIECVQQSKKELDFESTMEVQIVRVSPPEGTGFDFLRNISHDDFYKKHTRGHGSAIIPITNNDNMCLARAVVTAKAHYQHYILQDKSAQYATVVRGDTNRCTKQKKLAESLMRGAGLFRLEKQSCGLQECKKINVVLQKQNFQLKVFARHQKNTVWFDEEIPGCRYLYLYYHNKHYDVITSPSIFYGSNSFCDDCNRGYDRLEEHLCRVRCPCCKFPGKCQQNLFINCQNCNRRFKSKQCFDNHLKEQESTGKNNKRGKNETQSICMKLKKCRECGRVVAKSKLPPIKHRCGESYCSICKVYYNTGKKESHQCFMQPMKKHSDDDDERDLEPGENQNDPDDLDALVREEEDRQGETEEDRRKHFGRRTTDTVSKYLFWDFETVQKKIKSLPEFDSDNSDNGEPAQKRPRYEEKKIKIGKKVYSVGPIYEHVPNYCVVRKACLLCKDFWLSKCKDSTCKARDCERCQQEKPDCKVCGEHKMIFSGDECVDKFCRYLFKKEHKGMKAIAHNAKGFDAQFIIQWLADNEEQLTPNVTPRGRSILSLEALGVKIIDSHAFLPQSLASLPKTFNEPELKKGYFPYLFNKPENQNYVGPYPDADQYCPSEMKPEARKKFYQWYSENKNGIFDMQKELKEYTESDVDILLRCCLKFNDLFYIQTGIYPLDSAITIAQACNQVFRKSHLQPQTIGIIPTGGYRGREKQSLIALEWLRWISHKENKRVQHARNGGEKQIERYKGDGFIEESNTILEFNGCVWHGCPKCYKCRDKRVPNSSLTYEEAYQKTLDRAENIKKLGYNLLEIWECEWKHQKADKPEIASYLKQFDPFEVITGRDALYGGRTNATILWKKCNKGEKINYYDVCSLYPWVCKYGMFPLGHPRVISENFEEITENYKPYFGLIRCRVLPPRKLLHPVLPYRHGERLNFPLCRTCLETESQETCRHSDGERTFVGTFVSLELNKAVDLGYKVQEIFEVWDYDQLTIYDGETKEGGLFSSYINQFLKLKQEKSGCPAWVKTEDDKVKYIKDYEKREGINLRSDQIEKNPGLRAIAKLMLNSFWGKFAQKEDMASADFYTEPNEFFDAVLDKENQISAIRVLSDNMVAVTSKKSQDHQAPNPNTSVVLAAFVTAQARLKLYSYLENLQERVLYFDTDSVIFVTRPEDKYSPPTGDYLGDMTNELEDFGPGCYISEFVSCGPKQYSFTVVDPVTGKIVDTITKVKGFSLNYTNAAHINFKRMRRQVKTYVQSRELDTVTIYQPQIKRTETHKVVSETLRKNQRLVYYKRVVQSDFTSLPYGY